MEKINSKSDINLNTCKQEVPAGSQGSKQENEIFDTCNAQVRDYVPGDFSNNIQICQLRICHVDNSKEETTYHIYTGSGSLLYVKKRNLKIYGFIVTAANLFYKKGKKYCDGTIVFKNKQKEDFTVDILKVVYPRQYRTITFADKHDMKKSVYDFAIAIAFLDNCRQNMGIAEEFLEANGWLPQVVYQAEKFQSMLAQAKERKNETFCFSLLNPYQHDEEKMKEKEKTVMQIGQKRFSEDESTQQSLPKKSSDNYKIHEIISQGVYEVLHQYNASISKGQCGAIVGLHSKQEELFIPKAIHLGALQKDKNVCIGRNLYPDVIDFGLTVIEQLGYLLGQVPFCQFILEWETQNIDLELQKEVQNKEKQNSKEREKSRSPRIDTYMFQESQRTCENAKKDSLKIKEPIEAIKHHYNDEELKKEKS